VRAVLLVERSVAADAAAVPALAAALALAPVSSGSGAAVLLQRRLRVEILAKGQQQKQQRRRQGFVGERAGVPPLLATNEVPLHRGAAPLLLHLCNLLTNTSTSTAGSAQLLTTAVRRAVYQPGHCSNTGPATAA
jgi:hypothetical protein